MRFNNSEQILKMLDSIVNQEFERKHTLTISQITINMLKFRNERLLRDNDALNSNLSFYRKTVFSLLALFFLNLIMFCFWA
ncbi:hypothetical protein A9Q86_02240 [Flavobacteriales bacterium 33_180_T64]|nr:hypothetical protein A9Q86_02240 [Flavobacteriales bacterium 33_180_T64]